MDNFRLSIDFETSNHGYNLMSHFMLLKNEKRNHIQQKS